MTYTQLLAFFAKKDALIIYYRARNKTEINQV